MIVEHASDICISTASYCVGLRRCKIFPTLVALEASSRKLIIKPFLRRFARSALGLPRAALENYCVVGMNNGIFGPVANHVLFGHTAAAADKGKSSIMVHEDVGRKLCNAFPILGL